MEFSDVAVDVGEDAARKLIQNMVESTTRTEYLPDVPVVSEGGMLEGGMLDNEDAELRMIDFKMP